MVINKKGSTVRTICIIPARANSRRCPNKNTKPFCDMTLTLLACEQAIRLQDLFDKIVFTSNDPVAIAQAKSCGSDIIIRERPEEISGPEASSESAIEDAMSFVGGNYTHCLLLEVTSPLRLDSDITRALKLATNGRGVKSVVSVKNCIYGEVITDMFQLESSIHLWRCDGLYDTPYNRFNLLDIPAERAWHIDYQWQFDCAELIYKRLHHV